MKIGTTICAVAVLLMGCSQQFGGSYEVIEHTVQVDCAGDAVPVGGGPSHLLLVQDDDGISHQVDVFFCQALDACDEEQAWDYGVSWGAIVELDGWSRGGNYSSGTCNVSSTNTHWTREDGGLRIDIERRDGSFDGAELLGLSPNVTSGSDESRACTDALEEDPELIPCQDAEVLRTTLLE